MDPEFIEAFVEVFKKEMTRNNKVYIEGIGSFRVEHRKQFQKQYDDGRVVMMPPKETISFVAEN